MSLEQFIGFIEGRLRVAVPEYFLTISPSIGNFGVAFNVRVDQNELHAKNSEGPLLQNVEDAFIDKELIHVQLKGHDNVIKVPLAELADSGFLKVDAIQIDDSIWIIRFFGLGATLQNLRCVDVRTEEVKWKQVVWCAYEKRNLMGPLFHRSKMLVRDRELTIFGVATNALYIERFDIGNGKAIMRFGSTY
jgi:hypothetical protein